MSEYHYAFTDWKENMARAVGINLSISTKQSIMISKAIRGKTIDAAFKILDDAIAKKRPIAFTRFNADIGHKRGKGMASGRFPVKACDEFKRLLQSGQTNAQFKGLSTSNLKIIHVCAKEGTSTYRYGRQFRRNAKRTTVEIVLEEFAKEKKAAKAKAAPKKAEAKPAQEATKAPAAQEKPAPSEPAVKPEEKISQAKVQTPKPAEKKEEPKSQPQSKPAEKQEAKKETPKAASQSKPSEGENKK